MSSPKNEVWKFHLQSQKLSKTGNFVISHRRKRYYEGFRQVSKQNKGDFISKNDFLLKISTFY